MLRAILGIVIVWKVGPCTTAGWTGVRAGRPGGSVRLNLPVKLATTLPPAFRTSALPRRSECRVSSS